ncbi:hypothetical protein E4T47_07403 [Aureobasidium subglaciale]|nr:hypothetical protein E4T47_07403 [Aureobasidium subglaciale]
MATSTTRTDHYMDWPNACGLSSNPAKFDVTYQELEPMELKVSGYIPAYCAGVLYRNGLGPLEVQTRQQHKTFKTNHWFDCLAQVHRFQILAPTKNDSSVRVWHNSRRTCDGLIKQITETGDMSGITFAARYEPCKTFFKKLQSVFYSMHSPNETPDSVNICVTPSLNMPGFSINASKKSGAKDSGKVQTLINKTDATVVQALDPETLEPLGIARQTVLHPDLKGALSGAHAKVCPKTGDWYNFNLDFGRTGTYRVFMVSATTEKTEILATIATTPAYLHSSFLRDNYFVLCVWNSHISAGGVSILWKQNICEALSTFDSTKTTKWYVIDRKPASQGGKGLVSTFDSDPFFCFHTINAYEVTSEDDPKSIDIVADLCAYDNTDVLQRFYIDNLRSDSPTAKAYSHPDNANSKAYFRSFKLPGINIASSPTDAKRAINVARGDKGLAPELPSINHAFRGRDYRYVYGVTDTGKSTFFDGLVKYDTKTNAPAAVWSVHGHSAGEPIFIADPDAEAEEEDAGVLITAVLDGANERSHLLVLDAKDLKEVGRATMTGERGSCHIGFGFHGAHVRDQKAVIEGC